MDISFDDNITVISGGQNGADQAGLRAAKAAGLDTGGWAPKGWMTLDGPQEELLSGFGLKECQIEGYAKRTALNVRDSDVTIRFARNFGSPGERCTKKAIVKYKKPSVDFDVETGLTEDNASKLAKLIKSKGWSTINIAGNSERSSPGIGEEVESFLTLVFLQLGENHGR